MKSLRHIRRLGGMSALALLLLAPVARSEGMGWPRQFESTSGTFIVYQPQPEQLDGTTVTARAAFSLQKSDASAPAFGVLWFQARVWVDRDSSTVTESDLDVTKVRLPGASVVEAKRYEHLVEAEATGWDLSVSLEQLQSGLAASAHERLSIESLEHTPPRIVFSQQRALLVGYDGPPQLEPIEGSRLQRVVNTPYAVVFDPAASTYFLNGANLWYRAGNPLGPWRVVADPGPEVAAVVPPDTSVADQVAGQAPEVITATEPTELIVTDGEPLMAPLVGSRLLYVTNTENDVLRDAVTGTVYVLLSGRWYTAHSSAGPWSYIAADSLPAMFQQIPPDSPKGNLLASVAGTDAADDAVADNQIAQTSLVTRDDHDVAVEWDGPPQFERAAGTDLQYGANTDAQIVLAGGRYYLCDQGVWYVADDPSGPWSVSDVRPVGLDDVEPSCPIYNLRYVEIYGFSPEVVEVGYLPGYLGYYPCRGTVVYGTGYRYRPWRGQHRYYARPSTWGFHARYNPWVSRWSFGFSYWSGFLRVGLRWHAGTGHGHRTPPWLGPGGYHRPWLADDHAMVRYRPARTRPRVAEAAPANLYTRADNVGRVVLPGAPVKRTKPPGAGRQAPVPNDVFAGSDGRVYQRGPDGRWKMNQGRNWVPSPMPATPSAPLVPVRGGRGGGSGAPGGRDLTPPGTEPRPLPVQREPQAPVPVEPAPPVRHIEPPAPTPQPVQPAPVERAPAAPPVRRFERPAPTPRPVQPQRPEPTSRPVAPAPAVRPPMQPAAQPGTLERDFRARERSRPSAPAPRVAPAQPSPAPKPAPAVAPPKPAPTRPAREPAKQDAPPKREK